MSTGFIHLHLHTEYSIGDSVVRVKELAKAAAAAGMPAVAMTDRANLFAMVKFYRAAMACGVKPIIGAEILVQDPDTEDAPSPLVLLCKSRDGYHSLSKLLTRAYLEGQQGGVPVVSLDWLSPARGLLALSGGLDGAPGRAILAGREADARELVTRLTQLFDGDYYLQLQRTGRPGEEHYNREATALAAALGTPVVALEGPADVRQTRPLGARVRLVGRFDLPCVPCVKNRCPRTGQGTELTDARNECMWLISVDEVERAVQELLEGSRLGE